VPGRLTGEFHAGYGFLGWGQVAVAIPWATTMGESESTWAGYDAETLGGSGVGDLRIAGDFDLINAFLGDHRHAGGLGVGVGGTLWVPTGTDEALMGEALPRGEVRVAADWTAPFGMRIGGNAGLHLRETSVLAGYRNGPRFKWGGTVSIPLGTKALEIMATVFGAVPLDPLDVAPSTTPVEVLAGVKVKAPFGLRLQLAGGAGLTGGLGAPVFRVVGQVGWNFGLPEIKRPVPDDDEDGVPNDVDRCPLEPELYNAMRDEDGCPEANIVEEDISTADPGIDVTLEDDYLPADISQLPRLEQLGAPEKTDNDTLAPHEDMCPGESEDMDGFEDEDGCPDPDNDRDLVLDVDDLCPLIAESANGRLDHDGCPEPIIDLPDVPFGPDADKDGVDDSHDLCPLEPETINGVRDYDGCPESPESLEPKGGNKPFGTEGEPDLAMRLPQNGDMDGDGVADLSDACPMEPEDRDQFQDWDGCPDEDNDNDGVIDRIDRCPLEAENINGIIDIDGCPDVGADQDGDGVDDEEDRCPLEPENRNGLRDEDGCPEMGWVSRPAPVGSDDYGTGSKAEGDVASLFLLPPLPRGGDIDGDGLDVYEDDCPNEAEDMDGVLDGDGCPELDDDGDGFLDVDDECPGEAETFNGFDDEDGCADAIPKKLVDVSGVVRGIQFRSGSAVLLSSSYAILGEVVEALVDDETLLLKIDGHTDSQGDRQKNLDLAQARAEAVAQWLQSKGVADDRMSREGFGPDKPMASNDSEEGRSENRRVELSYSRKEETE
jgi:outer membrane protein OmpA-like peptidoglycan-associated protein